MEKVLNGRGAGASRSPRKCAANTVVLCREIARILLGVTSGRLQQLLAKAWGSIVKQLRKLELGAGGRRTRGISDQDISNVAELTSIVLARRGIAIEGNGANRSVGSWGSHLSCMENVCKAPMSI